MSGFILRIIAMITILVDHIACNLLDNQVIMRSFGRIAFPIYAFLLAEGFLIYYKDKHKPKIKQFMPKWHKLINYISKKNTLVDRLMLDLMN